MDRLREALLRVAAGRLAPVRSSRAWPEPQPRLGCEKRPPRRPRHTFASTERAARSGGAKAAPPPSSGFTNQHEHGTIRVSIMPVVRGRFHHLSNPYPLDSSSVIIEGGYSHRQSIAESEGWGAVLKPVHRVHERLDSPSLPRFIRRRGRAHGVSGAERGSSEPPVAETTEAPERGACPSLILN